MFPAKFEVTKIGRHGRVGGHPRYPSTTRVSWLQWFFAMAEQNCKAAKLLHVVDGRLRGQDDK
jgi:hypothetical protein